MIERIFHPTAGVHTTIKSVKDADGHRHYVYGQGTYEGRGIKDHQSEPNNWQSRNGVDIIVAAGTPIYAAFTGVISSDFGPLPKHAQDGPDSKFAGNRLTIDGADNRAYYAHLQQFADGIGPGVTVTQGQLIGYSGTAGNVQHLHIAIEKGSTEQFLRDAHVPVPPAETSNFTDASRGPVSDDFTRDRSDPDYPPPREAGPPPVTPADANSTNARTGNAMRASGGERAEQNYTPAATVSVPIDVQPDAPHVVALQIPSPPPAPATPDPPAIDNPDMAIPLDESDRDAGVPAPEKPDAGYVIPPPLGLKGGEWFDPVQAGAAVLRVESQLVNLVPFIGTLKGIHEAITGYDVLTDDKLDAVDRAINMLPMAAAVLKEISAAAKLEIVANEFRGASEFSSAMREIAIASGDADMLVDSLIMRLEALREMGISAGAGEMLQIQAMLEKLIDGVDTVADVAGVIGALPPDYNRDLQPQAPSSSQSSVVPAAAAGVVATAAVLGPSLDSWAASWDQGVTDLSKDSLDFLPLDSNLPALDSVSIASFAPEGASEFTDNPIFSASDLAADPGMSVAPQGTEDYSQVASFGDLGTLNAGTAAVTDGSSVLATFDASLDPGLAQSIVPLDGVGFGGDTHAEHHGHAGGDHGFTAGDHHHDHAGFSSFDDGPSGGFGGFDPGSSGGGGSEF